MSESPMRDEARFVKRLLGPAGPEISCEECFEQLDRYVELELSGADADAAIPGMAAHLEGCPACHEDHRSLRALVEAENTP
jgi:anti-sigma factor RsiW